jgi:ankyrin repeat protein
MGLSNGKLFEACKKGAVSEVQELLSKKGLFGCNITGSDANGDSALHYAVANDNREVAGFLIQKDLNVNIKNYKYETPLHYAAGNGHKEMTLLLINSGADVNARSKYQETPLHFAAVRGHKEIVILLIKKGADVNAKAQGPSTALIGAAGGGYIETARVLIENGAEINVKGEYGLTPLHMAVSDQNTRVTWTEDASMSNTSGEDADAVGTVVLLLKSGADVNAKADCDLTPLHMAAKYGHKETAALLIKYGADIDARFKDSITPLFFAEEGGHKEIADLIRNTNI